MLPPVYFQESIGTVICGTCSSGIVVNTANSINNHFRSAPHHLKGDALKAVHALFKEYDTLPSDKVPFPLLDDQPVPAIPHLRVHRGWFCRHCLQSLGTDLTNSKTHLRQVHQIYRGKEGHDIKQCLLQTVFQERKLVRYFRVQVEPDKAHSSTRHDNIDDDEINHHDNFVSSQIDVLAEIAEAEDVDARRVQSFAGHMSKVIPWVRSCGFDTLLDGFKAEEIAQSWQLPDKATAEKPLLIRVIEVARLIIEETW